MKLNNTADLVNALKIQQGISLNETGYTLLWIKNNWICLPLGVYWTIIALRVLDGVNNLKKQKVELLACRSVVFLVATKLKAFL